MFQRRAATKALQAGEDAYFRGELWTAIAPKSDQVAACLNWLGRVRQDQGDLEEAGSCSTRHCVRRPSARATRPPHRRPGTR